MLTSRTSLAGISRQPRGSSIATPSPVRLSSGTGKHPEQSSYSPYFPFFCLITSVSDMFYNYFTSVQPLPPPLPQPGAELRLPPHPRGSARPPAADGPPAEHCGLRLRPQPAPHPPVAGLCHPEARPRHPPLGDVRQRALSHLQRLIAGESGSGRLCDSSWQVIDGGVTRRGRNTSALTCYRQPPPHTHTRSSQGSFLLLVLSLVFTLPRRSLQQTTRGLLA